MWLRHYSRNDRKYYWLSSDDGKKEWDPWRQNGEKAPWMKVKQSWYKFMDPTAKRQYFYNYQTKQSTFNRPAEYESESEIAYDSAADEK